MPTKDELRIMQAYPLDLKEKKTQLRIREWVNYYGAHRDKGESRFQRLKHTHPKLYDYCMGGGTYDTDGFWVPTTCGLGMAHCIDALNKLYGKDFIKY